MSAALERRVRQYRSRRLILAWDYRQRHHSRGAWFRLRRLLAGASQAFVISTEDAAQLRAEGLMADPVGNEFEPPKVIVCVSKPRAAGLESAREVPVALTVDLLNARWVALVPFDTGG